MDNLDDYLELNKQTWNNKVDVHIASDFYENENFLNEKSTLNSIELDLLGNVSNKKYCIFNVILDKIRFHLQDLVQMLQV